MNMYQGSRGRFDVWKDVVTNVRLFLKSSINDPYIMEEVVEFLGEAFCKPLYSIQDIYEVETLEQVAKFCWGRICDQTNEDVIKNLQVNDNITRIKLASPSNLTDRLRLFFLIKSNLTHLHLGGGWKDQFSQRGIPDNTIDWLVSVLENDCLTYVDCRELFRGIHEYDSAMDELKKIYLNSSVLIKLDLNIEMVIIREVLMSYSTTLCSEPHFSKGMLPLTNDDFPNLHDMFTDGVYLRSTCYEKCRFQKVPDFSDFVTTLINSPRWSMSGMWIPYDEKGFECLLEQPLCFTISDPCKIFPAEEIDTTVLKHFQYVYGPDFFEIFETESKFLVLQGDC
jgi:hypothetical protein